MEKLLDLLNESMSGDTAIGKARSKSVEWNKVLYQTMFNYWSVNMDLSEQVDLEDLDGRSPKEALDTCINIDRVIKVATDMLLVIEFL